MSLISLLQRWGVLPKISKRDVDEAQFEDVIRTSIENSRALRGALAASQRAIVANGRLRDSVRRVRSSSVLSNRHH